MIRVTSAVRQGQHRAFLEKKGPMIAFTNHQRYYIPYILSKVLYVLRTVFNVLAEKLQPAAIRSSSHRHNIVLAPPTTANRSIQGLLLTCSGQAIGAAKGGMHVLCNLPLKATDADSAPLVTGQEVSPFYAKSLFPSCWACRLAGGLGSVVGSMVGGLATVAA